MLGLCTRLRDTAFKRSLAEMPVGADVDVEQPKGDFVLPEDTDRPLRVHRRRDRHNGLPLHAPLHRRGGLPYQVTLVYSNRDRESTAFLEELEELDRDNPNIRARAHDDRRPGLGRRDAADRRRMLRDHLDDDLDSFRYLVAGPPPMAEGVGETLKDAGVPRSRSGRTASAATTITRAA